MRNFLLISIVLSYIFIHSSVLAKEDSNHFELVTITLNDGGIGIAKCNIKTGEGWYRSNNKWIKGTDLVPAKSSHYRCRGQAYKDKGWLFVRMDTESGETWVLEEDVWKKVLD